MNGSLPSSSNLVDIKLKRGPAGLGFNIVGGVDQQFVVDDSGIYVSKIKEDGAAALDGRLQEGDKILAINGVKLENRTHKAAVELFRTAGEDVELCVLKKLPSHMNGPSPSHSESSGASLLMLGAFVGAIALMSFFTFGTVGNPFNRADDDCMLFLRSNTLLKAKEVKEGKNSKQ